MIGVTNSTCLAKTDIIVRKIRSKVIVQILMFYGIIKEDQAKPYSIDFLFEEIKQW